MKYDNTEVYSIPCNDCKQVYVGQTARSLHIYIYIYIRIKEHKHNLCSSQYSALANHYQSGHNVSFDSANIIHSEQNITKRLIAEALLIRNNPTLTKLHRHSTYKFSVKCLSH